MTSNIYFHRRIVCYSDINMLWQWRNDPITRMMSINKNEISWESHREWFYLNLNNTKKQLWLYEYINQPVAVIGFNDRIRHTVMSITLSPEMRGKGFASRIIILACHQYQKALKIPIFAYIKLENTPSLKAFSRSGFIRVPINNNQLLLYIYK